MSTAEIEEKTNNNNEELNHLYSCSRWAGYNPELVVQNFIKIEEIAYSYMKQAIPVEEDVPYGRGERQKIDIWGKVGDRLFIFFHGGYWQEGDRKHCLSPSVHIVRHLAFASVGYTLATKERPLSKTVRDCLEATKFIVNRYPDVKEFIIGGHSAGAHLAYQVAVRLRHPKIKKIALFSPVLKLEELVCIEIGQAIGLTMDEAQIFACHPQEVYDLDVKLFLLSALKDSPRLIEQNRIFYSSLKIIKMPLFHELLACDHFNLMSKFQDYKSEQSELLCEFLGIKL